MKKCHPSYKALLFLINQALIGSTNDFERSLLDTLAKVADKIVSRAPDIRYYKISIDFGEEQ